jgi:translocation-and-assembly-module (TAM) inner membrane subunit TamB-like protein
MSDPPELPPSEPETPRRRSRVKRAALYLLAFIVAVVAGVLVTVFTIDLGPNLRGIAEREGSKRIKRPMHIGRLSARLTPGVFVLEDLVIEGLTPQDRPFLTAKKITVEVPWWTAFSRKLVIESIQMTDWNMVVETFANGRHNFPSFGGGGPKKEPGTFTTTLRSVVASRGQFTYDDHTTPWSTVAHNLDVQVYRPPIATTYLGRASFSNGTVKIQSYEPFRTDMQSRFSIDKGIVHFSRIDLLSDGARSVVDGDVDLGHWPEQLYKVRSQIDFATQKEIFFHGQNFKATGTGDFTGTFHLFKGGRELKGSFVSPVAGVTLAGKTWRFPDLRGDVVWVPEHLDIVNAKSQLYGGTAAFDYKMGPFGTGKHANAVWDVAYKNVDLARLTDFLEIQGIRLTGRATGRNRLEWPLGRWGEKRGSGEINAQPPAGIATLARELDPAAVAERDALPKEAGPFNGRAPLGYVPIAGHIAYSLDPEWITLGKSWSATPGTFVEFEGITAYGERSKIPFHVTSLDWQESDRVLAGIMTAFGSSTGAVPIGGHGQFDGVMLLSFGRPRIEGHFAGDRMRAWDVFWGSGTADVVIENSYANVSNAVLRSGDAEIRADGQFSLGYPRKDDGEEINARVSITRWPIGDLKHAFLLDDYRLEGLTSGEYHLYGKYETPFGYGKMLIEKGVAYGEPFERATSSLRFEGNGVRLDGIEIVKVATGRVTGAAFVGWDGTYSFNADGTRIPVESLAVAAFPRAPLSGLLQFNAAGAGTFDEPHYDVRLNVEDLFAGDEGIGHVTGRLGLRGELLNLEFEAASPRLNVSGSGRIALTPEMDAEATVRFVDTSLDPYIRFFEPRLSPFTNAVVGGTLRVVGELADVDHMVVEGTVERLDLKLFDYRVENKEKADATAPYVPIKLALDRHVLNIEQMRLAGEGTELQVQGRVAFDENRISVAASGDANLGILQGFFRDLRSRGTAAIKAQIDGPLDKPVFSGSATLVDGRIRHPSMPHALEAINGRLSFDAGGIRVDDVTARLGAGDVHFGGRIGLNGFVPAELNLTATGEHMRVRYPEGFISTIAADLTLQGPIQAPVLGGTVTVEDALWSRRIEATPDLLNLTGSTSAAGAAAPSTAIPIRFDITIAAPSTLRIKNNIANMVASADLRLQGTYDKPLLFGHAEIDRGDIIFEGNRYTIARGGVDFFNPARIEPVFDIEAETRVRLPEQIFQITIAVTGPANRLSLTLNSDPPLSDVDIVTLLLGGVANPADLQNSELRGVNASAVQQSQEELLKAAVGRLLTNPVAVPVTRIAERGGVDVVIAPTWGTEADPLTPSARLIVGRRISERAYLTFARALGGTQRDQIIVLDYDQNERLGWVLTQTGDRTFAIEFRVRHRF